MSSCYDVMRSPASMPCPPERKLEPFSQIVVALKASDSNLKPVDLYDPLTGKHDLKFTAPKAYYRMPTLVSIWATAP